MYGLCTITDAIPRVELATILLPTNTMKSLVAAVYASFLKFPFRSLQWYEEGKIVHAIHSITRPAALRYDDVLRDIDRATRSIVDPATPAVKRSRESYTKKYVQSGQQLTAPLQSMKLSKEV